MPDTATSTAAHFPLGTDSIPVRDDLPEAFRAAWRHIATPGPGWTGAERVAIADETRRASTCALCLARKDALSPNAVSGDHDHADRLPAPAVEAVHRIATDPGRLTETWFHGIREAGISDAQYVEIIGIVSTIVSIDTFCLALDAPLAPLPEPEPGEPTGYRPDGLVEGGGWLPMLTPRKLAAAEAELFGGMPQTGNVLRAMSLVPDEVRNLNRVADVMYLGATDVMNFTSNGGRALSRPQIELLASRVSALNGCFY